ncbi:MAG: DUF4878 domain-containing protein [Desulfovibrionaceae bacterium]
MMRKIVSLAAVLVLFSVLLSGCGGPGPEKTAQAALENTVSGNFDEAFKHFCKKMKDDMPPKELMDEIRKELEQFKFDFSGLKYEVVEEKGDTAKIRVSGTIKAKSESEEKNEDMDETIELIKEDGQWKVCE